MNYSELSDFEINSAVTAIVCNCQKWEFDCENGIFYHCGIDGNGYYEQKTIDFCNNPVNAWPIILENKIDIRFEAGFMNKWESQHVKHLDDYDVDIIGCNYDKNPLRAAMITFLMMNED